jgi:hypothetical protein
MSIEGGKYPFTLLIPANIDTLYPPKKAATPISKMMAGKATVNSL